MAGMAAITSSSMNCSPYLDMASSMNGGTRGTIDVHLMVKTKYASSWGLRLKYATKINATRVGAMQWNMLFPTVKTILLKPLMMLDREQNGPYMVPDLGLRRMVQDDDIFRQKFCIRSYEVGPDGKASVETLMHHLQETAVNHLIKTIGVMPDQGFASEEMYKKNLTWVMAKMQMVVDRYPSWGDVVQIDTWKTPYGKTGVFCNYIFCDIKTHEILVKASSIWVMMNKKTKKLSKFPYEVRAKLEQHYVDTPPIVKQDTPTWSKTDKNVQDHICKGLTTRWSDLDINQHVNNVKYIGWILQSVPKTILENYEIDSMAIDYYREVTEDTVLQSLTSILANKDGEIDNYDVIDCQHSLQFEAGYVGDIMKGRTRWRLKYGKSQDS